MTKINMKFILILTFLLYVFSALSCENNPSETTIIEPNPLVNEKNELARNNLEKSGIVSTIEFYGWWWNDNQFNSKEFDLNTPKEGYLELERWDASDGFAPHPDKLDINCRVENNTSKVEKLTFVLKADFKEMSYSKAINEDKLDKAFEALNWKNELTVGRVGLTNFQANETRTLSFQDFDIGRILNKYFESEDDNWAWKLRVRLYIYNEKNQLISKNEKVLDLIPGD